MSLRLHPLAAGILFTLVLAFAIWACRTVAITGRQQLNLIPRQTILAMSYEQYAAFLSVRV